MDFDFKSHNGDGLLITFCGLDGCGKTTMIRMLEEELAGNGFSVSLTKQPTNAMRETEIFRTFMDEEDNSRYEYRAMSMMAAADRIQHSNKYIEPLLEKGEVVISDRYFYSCIANLKARGYKKDRWIYETMSFIPKPDIAFFLDVDVDTSIKRIRQRESEKDKWIDYELQYKLRSEYLDICDKFSGILIDSSGDKKETFNIVRDNIFELLKEKYCFREAEVNYG